MTTTRRGRWILLSIVAIFGLPWIAALALYFISGVSNDGHAAAGRLLDPPRPLPRHLQAAGSGRSLDTADVLGGHWTIVQVAVDDCGQDCRSRLAATRQVRALLHRDAARVQRLLLLGPAADVPRGCVQPDLLIGRMKAESLTMFSSQSGSVGDTVYLVDPHGRRILRYADFQHGERLRRDLSRLLLLSPAG